MNKAVFLDRDGVINECALLHGKPSAPTQIQNFILFPGVLEAISEFKIRGFFVFVITNQPDISKGNLSQEDLFQMHTNLMEAAEIDDIFVCPHLEIHNCFCRKPKIGMIKDAQKKYSINLQKSFVVGDRWRDVEAAKNAGCTSILVGTGYNEKKITPDFQVNSLVECLKIIR